MIPDSAYTVVVVFPLAALRASPAEGQILLKTLMLMLVLYLCGNNNQWQQRVGCDCRGLGFQLKPSSIWSEPGPCFNNYCSPNYRCHISQSPTDYKHKHIHTMITCSLLQHFTKHPANPPFFFLSWPALTWGPEAIRPLQSERCVVDCVPANPFEVLSWCDYVFVLVLGGQPNK